MPTLTAAHALWAILATLITVSGGALVAYLKTRPDHKRADNEATVIAANVAEKLRLEAVAAAVRLKQEFDDLNKQNRKDIHDLKDQMGVTEAALYQANKRLLEAASVQREDRADMDSMVFLIRILIDEVKRLDPNPDNRIIAQAEIVLSHMGRRHPIPSSKEANVHKSDALLSAENAVTDARQTLNSTRDTCEQLKCDEEADGEDK